MPRPWAEGRRAPRALATVALPPVKNPGLAAVLSFVVCGLGQIYNGQIAKGLLFLAIFAVSIPLMVFGIGWITGGLIWLAGIIDAYATAERLNP
jgi:TM2 domain-containing membrane protein YozV